MSNVYITEPGTEGKVLLHTSFGDLDVELWPQQAPKACRNFVQLCLEGVRCVAPHLLASAVARWMLRADAGCVHARPPVSWLV